MEIKRAAVVRDTVFALVAITAFSCVPACSGSTSALSPIQEQNAPRLPLIARVLNFPSGQLNKGRVVILAEVNYTDLVFVRNGDRYTARIEYSFSLSRMDDPRDKHVIDRSLEITVFSFAETTDRKRVARITEELDVPTGKYAASLLVLDKNADSRGFLSHTVDVHDMLSQLSMTEPLLVWDSVHALQSDKLIPFSMSTFDKNFFAFVMLSGLDTTQTVTLVYKLQDNREQELFERSVTVQPQKRIIIFSLPVPHKKLSLGTTTLKVLARHKDQNVSRSLNIRANFGYQPSKITDISVLIGPMRYVMDKKEYDRLANAPPDSQLRLFNAFWEKRNPRPGSETNPLLEEFYYRVETANARFGWAGGEGYLTDRGRILIIYGPPDSVQNTRRPGSAVAYEIWTYHELGRRFVFIDKYNDGNYQLLTDTGG